MKKILLFLFLLNGVYLTYGQSVYIGTYNVGEASLSESSGGNGWERRRPVITQMLGFEHPDIMGLQDLNGSQLSALVNGMEGYRSVGAGADDGESGGLFSPLIYNPDSVSLESSGDFWLSDTPDEVSTGWNGQGRRVCSWGRFTKGGRTFYVFNVLSDSEDSVSCMKSSALVLSRAKSLSGGYPYIITGSLSTDESSAPYKTFISGGMSDAYSIATERYAETGTLSQYQSSYKSPKRYDDIFVSPGISVGNYGVLVCSYFAPSLQSASSTTTTYTRRQPSYHYPVLGRFFIPNVEDSISQATDTVHLKVMTYNIYSGQKVYSGVKGVETIADVISSVNPDVVGLEEFETESSVVDDKDMVSLLKEKTGLPYAFFVHTTYPHGGDYGNLILSRYPLSDETCYTLPRDDTDVDIYPRAMGVVSVNKNNAKFHFIVTHLSSTLESNRILQAQSLIDTISSVTGPIILVGDFNAYADSKPLNVLYKRFELSCINGNYGLTIDTPVPTKAIDFILHTPNQGVTPISYNVDYAANYQSDHFPVVAKFSVEKSSSLSLPSVSTYSGAYVPSSSSEKCDSTLMGSVFWKPCSMDFGKDGGLYVVEDDDHDIRLLKDGRVSTYLKATSTGGLLYRISGIAFSPSKDTMYVSNDLNGSGSAHLVAIPWSTDHYDSSLMQVLWSTSPSVSGGSGITGVSVHPLTGDVFCVSHFDGMIYKYDRVSGQMVSTGVQLPDGSGNAATKVKVRDMVFDSSGTTVYISSQNHGVIYKGHYDLSSGQISDVRIWLGKYDELGYQEGVGTDTRLSQPYGMAVDSAGNVYVAVAKGHRIACVSPEGVMTTYAGTGISGTTDGSLEESQFDYPMGLRFGPDGALYISEYWNHKIRKIIGVK